jgi:hypothetical protein
MKHSLPHRPLRFATARAYDVTLQGPGRSWVERSAQEFSLDGPIETSHEDVADAAPSDADTAQRPYIHEETRTVCTNPLRDEPSPVAIGAVKRFGLVGLVTYAVSAGIARWWNSLSKHDH